MSDIQEMRNEFNRTHKLKLTNYAGDAYIVPMDGEEAIVSEMMMSEMEEQDVYKIECIVMTDEELDALPEFEGF